MVGSLRVSPCSDKEARFVLNLHKYTNKLAKCTGAASIMGMAVSGAVHYFGGPEYAEVANQCFQYSGTALAGSLFVPLIVRAAGTVVGPMADAEREKRAKTPLLEKSIL